MPNNTLRIITKQQRYREIKIREISKQYYEDNRKNNQN